VIATITPQNVMSGDTATMTLTVAPNASARTISLTITGISNAVETIVATPAFIRQSTAYFTLNSPPSGLRTLTDSKWVKQLSGAADSRQYFKFTVPAGQKELSFTLSSGNGNADLFADYGQLPLHGTSNLCRSTRPKNSEQCTISVPEPGTYYVVVRGATDFTQARLQANVR
jgi:hypothetical protein